MKAVLVALALVVGVVTLSPKIVGHNILQSLESTVNTLDESAMYQVDLRNLKQDWYNTSADIHIQLDAEALKQNMASANAAPEADAFAQDVQLTLHFRAEHGPLLNNLHEGLGWMAWTLNVDGESVRQYTDLAEDQAFFQQQGLVSLLMDKTFSDQIPALTISGTPDGSEGQFSGYVGKGDLSGGHFSYQGQADSFEVANEQATLVMDKLAISLASKGDLNQMLQGILFDGQSALQIQRIALGSDAKTGNFSLNNLAMHTDTKVDEAKGLVNMQITYTLDELTLDEASTTDLVLAMELANVSTDFLTAYQKFLKQLAPTDPEQMQANLKTFAENHLLAFLQAEPEFNITELSGTLPEGQFSGSVNAKIVNVEALPDTLADQSYWFKHLKAGARLQADKALAAQVASGYMQGQIAADPQAQTMSANQIEEIALQQAPVMLANLEQQGLITATDEQFSMLVTLENGEANLNGKAIPLPVGQN